MTPKLLRWLAAFFLLWLTGCATHSETFRIVEKNLANQQPELALRALEKQKGSRKDEVLYLLNKAMLLRMAGDYQASTATFEAAQQRMEALSALSLREQGTSFIINDGTRSYVGEPFEQVMVHVYKALNYLQLGERDGARVEALQIDLKLRELGEKSGRHLGEAFPLYLTGIIYEDLGEWSDAMIAYRKAYEVYLQNQAKYRVDVPGFLKMDLLRLAHKLDLGEERDKYQREFALQDWQDKNQSEAEGELIFVLNNGLAPIKMENSVVVPNPSRGSLVRISLPYYQPRPLLISKVRVNAADGGVEGERVENIAAIATENLAEQVPAITARSVARVVAKQQMAVQARKNNNDALAAVIDIIGFITEQADTRAWSTLPQDIYLARFPLGSGSYTVKIELRDRMDNIVAVREFQNILIQKGKKTYLSYHWISL